MLAAASQGRWACLFDTQDMELEGYESCDDAQTINHRPEICDKSTELMHI